MRKLFLLAIVGIFSITSYSQTETTSDLKYKRSSLYTLMVSDDSQEHSEAIKTSFMDKPIPEKFNNHLLSERTISKVSDASKSKSELDELQKTAISDYFTENHIAKLMVAKWFNRSENGGFNMDLISERGNYNATDLDVKIAKSSERGNALLSDAGEELIKNTFVVVNHFKYTNKEEVAEKAKSIMSVAGAIGGSKVRQVTNVASEGATTFGKGYVIKTDAHLYKLVWNDEIAAIFYNDYWTEDGSIDEDRVKAFDESDIFTLEYIGTETAWADLQSTAYTTKTDEELISIATVKASDAVIAKLQRTHEVFRTKTPLLSGDPLSAKIGLKEGLEKGDKYEVLEQTIDKDGKTVYERVGVIKVDKSHIWDNRYMASEESESEFEYTTFSGSSNKYFSGMLIRQIN